LSFVLKLAALVRKASAMSFLFRDPRVARMSAAADIQAA
jgi:hypothetical protein